MNELIKTRFFQILLLSFALFLTNCVSDEYDLSDGINTEITVGGDSLSIPIGKVKPIVLGEMIDSLGADIIKKSENGTYSLRLNDSIDVEISAINPVNVSVSAITIPGINTNVADIKFPVIQFNPVSLNSTINVPVANTSNLNLPAVNSSYKKSIVVTAPSGIKGFNKSNASMRSKSAEITFGPYEAEGTNSVGQNINFTFDNVLKKINKIYFKSSRVTVTFNKSEISAVGFTSHKDTIKSFRIDYPSTFKLTNNIGAGTSIQGSSFIITDSPLEGSSDIFTYSFVVESLDMSNEPQSGSLNYNATVPYSIKYNLIGQADENSTVVGKTVGIQVNLSATPLLDDLDMVTNPIVLSPSTGNSAINEVVNDLPLEVDVINSLNFENGAALQLKIDDPGISPFSFTGGTCTVNLPQVFMFKPFAGLNTTTNVLTIPYSELFQTKNIGIAGVKLNKKVVDQSITINDAINYSINNLTVGGSTTKLSTTQSLGTKNLNVRASTNGLTVSDASITTNKIQIDIPSQNADIKINELVSTDVKKIYTIGLKTPAQITLKIDVKNLPSSIDSIFFQNYTIKLPASMKFKTGDVNMNNELILNRGFKVSEGFTKILTLESFDFGSNGIALTNGYFVLNETVNLKGGAYIKSSSINSNELSTVTINPKITIGSMPISVIEGQVSTAIDPISESIELDMPETLKNGDNNLDIQNPVITLEIGNTMGIPIDLNLNLIPKRKGVAIPNASISTTISVAAATNLGAYTWSKFWIAKTNEGVTAGFTPVIIPELSNLLKTIPDEIEIKATAVITGTRHKVDLYSAKNALNVKYSVNVPLDFGENFRIQYRDSISDLKEDLKDYIEYVNEIDIVAIVANEIPMDLTLTMSPLDESNNIISGITLNTADKIRSCGIDGSAQTSIITLGIKETEAGALGRLNAFDFTVNASKNSTVAGIPLKSDQTVEIELRVRIPEGITISPK
ncbi:MAG: hypothetical protein LLF95_06105 [Bacteroidales bacterium]|nr:hypothetical protein [Bacteroidales bacterium]